MQYVIVIPKPLEEAFAHDRLESLLKEHALEDSYLVEMFQTAIPLENALNEIQPLPIYELDMSGVMRKEKINEISD